MKLTVDQVIQTESPPMKKKKQRPEKRKPARAVQEPIYEEDVYEDDGYGDEPTYDPDDGLETVYEPETESAESAPKRAKWKTALLVAALVLGFALVVWNLFGLVNNMRMEGTKPPTQTETSADVPETGLSSETVSKETEESGAAAPDSDEISKLRDENTALKEAVAQAQNDKEMAEQELRNAKALLEASTAREAELRTKLESSGVLDKE